LFLFPDHLLPMFFRYMCKILFILPLIMYAIPQLATDPEYTESDLGIFFNQTLEECSSSPLNSGANYTDSWAMRILKDVSCRALEYTESRLFHSSMGLLLLVIVLQCFTLLFPSDFIFWHQCFSLPRNDLNAFRALASTVPSICDYMYICAFAAYITWWLFPNADYFPVAVVSVAYMVATLMLSLYFNPKRLELFYKWCFSISNPNATPQQIKKANVSLSWHFYLVSTLCHVFVGFFFLAIYFGLCGLLSDFFR